MQVAKYWRNNRLRYRLIRSLEREQIANRAIEGQRQSAAPKPTAPAKRELAGVAK